MFQRLCVVVQSGKRGVGMRRRNWRGEESRFANRLQLVIGYPVIVMVSIELRRIEP